MDPKTFMALSQEQKNEYLKSLSVEDRLLFVRGIDRYEQDQILAENGDPANNPIIAPLPTAPIKGVSNPSPSDPGSDIANIKPEDKSVEEKDAFLKDNINKLKDRMTNVASVTAAFTDMANLSNPGSTEIAPSAISGGVTGLISGGPIGAVVGAVTGALKAGNQRESFDQQEAERMRTKFKGLRVAPAMAETGGMVKEDALEEIPVQEEVGEMMLFPDGKLVEAMATKRHKDLKGDEKDMPTDIIPNGTMIFSDSEKRIINLTKIQDDIFTVTKGHYSEDGNTKGEIIRMKDVYGTGKMTPAAIAKKVQKMTPIVENPIEQIEVETNKENLRKRAELLLPIMQMQEGVYKPFTFEKPMKFEKGGMAKKSKGSVPKCETGGIVDPKTFVTLSKEERDAYIASLPSYEEKAKFMQGVYDLGIANFTEMGAKPPGSNSPTDPGVVTDNTVQNKDQQITVPGATGPLSIPAAKIKTTNPETPISLDLKLPQIDDKLFGKVDSMIADQTSQNEADYNSSVQNADTITRSARLSNMATMFTKLGADGIQNPEVTPLTLGTEHVNSMYPKVTESQIQAQVNPVRAGQSRVLSAINDSGISGANVGSAIASTQARLIDSESDVRNKALTINQSQDAKRFERLKSIVDLNAAADVNAENSTRSNRNKLIADVGTTVADKMKADTSLKVALDERLAELKKWRAQNKNTITDSQFNAMVEKEKLRLDREYKGKQLADFAELMSQFKVS